MKLQQQDARIRMVAGTLVISLLELSSIEGLQLEHFEIEEGEREVVKHQLIALCQLLGV